MIAPGNSGTAKNRVWAPSFLAGVATSGYQCEGGYNGDRQPKNNWAAHELAGKVARTGAATDFWNRYREDFELCRGMGLNAFRLSIEWARVQPGEAGIGDHHIVGGRAPEGQGGHRLPQGEDADARESELESAHATAPLSAQGRLSRRPDQPL